MKLRVGTREFVLSGHALDRYVERVRPGLARRQAAEELGRLAPVCGSVNGPPGWLGRFRAWDGAPGAADPDEWLMLGDDVCLPVTGGMVMTCLVRGQLSETVMMGRRRERAARRSQKRASRRGRDPRPDGRAR